MVDRVWRDKHFHTTASSMTAQKHMSGKQHGVCRACWQYRLGLY